MVVTFAAGLTRIANITAEGIVRYARSSKAEKLHLVVEDSMKSALLTMSDFPSERVELSTDKRLFYERGGCGIYYR